MKIAKYTGAAFFICCAFFCFSQKRGSVWCFGDSALVDFSDTSNILTGVSKIKSRGSCASICDSAGQLSFYASYDIDLWTIGGPPFKNGEIWNKLHQTMQNGDSIAMAGWYHEVVIIPYPGNSNQYYVFSIGVTSLAPDAGIFYAIVDMSANGGLGAVIQKNVQLQTFKMVDCLTAIKHGNGRDWWILFRKSEFPIGSNADYYEYLVTPAGISNVNIQNIGSLNSTNLGQISFNTTGNRFVFINYKGLMELYDFDRCTGVISNPEIIYPENTQSPWPQDWSAEFSPSDSILYVTHVAAFAPDSCYLIQYDLTVANIAASGDTLWKTPFNRNMGQLKLAPDNKIYLTCNYKGGYPYHDTLYNNINMNLSVINSPDSLGSACDLQQFSFSLGGKRTYFGLPNNPNYDLGAWIGSVCDTLGVGIAEQQNTNAQFFIYYATNWQTAFINAQKLTGSRYELLVYDILGNIVFKETGKLNPPYFTNRLNCATFAKGIYIVSLQTEKEKLVKKFIKE